MWRRIRVCIAALVAIALIAVATAQAAHAWRNTEGLDQGEQEGSVGSDGSTPAADTGTCTGAGSMCSPTDMPCKVAEQGALITRLQVTVEQLNKVANEALTKAEHAASAATKVATAANEAHKARQNTLKNAVAPLASTGSPPLAAPPASKGDIASMAKSS